MKKQALEQAQEHIAAARGKIYDLCWEIESARWGNTNHHAIRFNPQNGSVYTTEDPSWTCSQDEYFKENGELSQTTLWSGQGWCEYPDADSGYEWDTDENGDLIGDFETGQYETIESLDDEEVADFEAIGWKKFSVSTRPIDPDYSEMEREINESLDALEAAIEEKIEELEED